VARGSMSGNSAQESATVEPAREIESRETQESAPMTSWYKKLTVPRIEAARPLAVISAFKNGGFYNLDTGDTLEFPDETSYVYLGEAGERSVIAVDIDLHDAKATRRAS